MSWIAGNPKIQDHYRQGRDVRLVKAQDIESVCDCGYLTLKPANSFEEHNGGLTVKRSKVEIVSARTGEVVKRFRRPKGMPCTCCCNACANDWK